MPAQTLFPTDTGYVSIIGSCPPSTTSHLDRQYVLDKLLEFHHQHGTPPVETLRDLRQAVEQIPRSEHAAEAAPLQNTYQRARRSRRQGPQPIGKILVEVLARLGVVGLQSEVEAPGPDADVSETGTR
jgi:hypothetical protein